MNKALIELAERIRSELKDMHKVLQRAEEESNRSRISSDDMYMDGAALNLHGFYSGLERLFELTANVVDGSKPQSSEWHRELLDRMAREISGIRPAVISTETLDLLDELRRFRHLIRNVYTFNLIPVKVEDLLDKTTSAYEQICNEMLTFAKFLDQKAREELE
ncbi:MAG: antitoxin [Chloroflexi bacterium]|nr:antitoxin [Chloroflexota bacterium]